MSAFVVDTPFSVVLWIALEASVILAAAAILQALWRRRTSAAARHLAWTVVAVSLLVLPLARTIVPEWPVRIAAPPAAALPTAIEGAADRAPASRPATPPSATAAPVAGALDSAAAPAGLPQGEGAPVAPRLSLRALALGVYGAGAAFVLLFFARHRVRIQRLAGRADVVTDAAWLSLLADAEAEIGVSRRVRLVRSREVVVPMTFGTRTPTILLPAIADLWSADRRRAVLLHEVAHVARYDCFTQALALAACAAYWPHPGVWWVARRLRVERELACDDCVLAAGAEPREYAGHLLEIAYSLDGGRAPALAVSMARPSQLEGRLLAALDAARNRRRPGLGVRMALAVTAAVAVVALAGATPTTETVNTGQYAESGAAAGDVRVEPAARASQPSTTTHQLKEVDWAPLVAVRRLVERAASRVAEIAQDDLPGTWELRPSTKEGLVHLRLVEGRSSHGSDIPLSLLEGLTATQLEGAGGPVQFRITRDAGTLQFEGVLRNRVAAGTFSFSPNPTFPDALAKRGFARPTAREQYQMARHDVGFAFVDELTRLGYAKPETALLVKAGQHGVNTTYLREMGALGYALGSLPPLIELRDHGVTPDYVRGMAQEGYAKVPADEIRKARDHGVGPEYVKGMREAGYTSLPLEALIEARDHGVTPEYVRALAAAGYRGLPIDQTIRVRDHGVSPEYVEGMKRLGYTPAIEELVKARDHGVTPEFAQGMAESGYARTPLDRLIKARDHGVTPEYAKAVKALGYDALSLDDLVQLRDHGITAERIRAANDRAGTRLPIDLLRDLASGGGLR